MKNYNEMANDVLRRIGEHENDQRKRRKVMAKLYPPYIEGTLPAFCLKEGDGTITIPFAHNKAVSKADIGNMYIKVKTVQNDVLISSGPVDGYDKENCTMTINVSGGSALNGK